MGSREGSSKIAAHRLGMTPEAYLARIHSGEKWCYQCRLWKSVAEFSADKSRGDKRKAVCKACGYTRTAPGPSKSERRKMSQEGSSWCRHCDKWRIATEVHGGLCQTHANEEARRRYSEDQRYRMARRQHAHSRKRGVRPIPAEGQELILEDFNGACAYCGSEATTWDHIVPVVQGGQTTPGNIVPVCATCNSSKKDREVFSWLEATGRTPSDAFAERIIHSECGLWG